MHSGIVVVGVRIFKDKTSRNFVKSRPAETSQQPRDTLGDKEQCILAAAGPSRPPASLS